MSVLQSITLINNGVRQAGAYESPAVDIPSGQPAKNCRLVMELSDAVQLDPAFAVTMEVFRWDGTAWRHSAGTSWTGGALFLDKNGNPGLGPSLSVTVLPGFLYQAKLVLAIDARLTVRLEVNDD